MIRPLVSILPRALLLALSLALPFSLAAAAPSTELDLLRSLAGRWQGTLSYRDYQDDSLQELGLDVVHEIVGGGDYLLRRLTYSEGERTSHAVELVTIERDSRHLMVSHFRDRKASFEDFSVQSLEVRDAEHWTMVVVTTGDDDYRLALVRLTQTRDGDSYVARKDVQFLVGDDTGEWQFRNEAKLRRLAP